MDSKIRQQALSDISVEDLAKVKAHQAKTTSAIKVDDYWLLLAEFGMAFGWQAYKDAVEDKIDAPTMMTLVEASRRIKASERLHQAEASFIGSASAQTKSPSQTFTKLTKRLSNMTKVDE